MLMSSWWQVVLFLISSIYFSKIISIIRNYKIHEFRIMLKSGNNANISSDHTETI